MGGVPTPEALLAGAVWYVAFLFSVILHEASHAWAARLGGDSTAYEGGQVTLDPRPHLRREPLGMVWLPLFSILVAGWPLGFASAPYDPRWARRHPRRAGWMALAGPASNAGLVVVAALGLQIGLALGGFTAPERATHEHLVDVVGGATWAFAGFALSVLFTLNLILCLFNLLPCPPLDGAGALALVLPADTARRVQDFLARPGFSWIGLFAAWWVFGRLFGPVFRLALGLLHPDASYR